MKRVIAVLAMVAVAAVSLFSVTVGVLGAVEVTEGGFRFVGMTSKADEEEIVPFVIPDATKLEIPEELDNVGLYLYKNGNYYNVLDGNLDVDLDKPIAIFAHGMKNDIGHYYMQQFPSSEKWTDYNTFVFNWAPFCDSLDPMGVGIGEWMASKIPNYKYADESGDRKTSTEEQTAKMKHSIAEVYASNYVYLMEHYDFTSNIIKFSGHSMGGQLTAAVANYLMYAYEHKGLPAEYMPSAFYLLDPYIETYNISWLQFDGSKTIIDWSGEAFGDGGTAGLVDKTIQKGKEYGIPICYILSGIVNISVSEEQKDAFKKVGPYIDLAPDHWDNPSDKHVFAESWFFRSNAITLYDASSSNVNYCIAASTPFQYLSAMIGNSFRLDNNDTKPCEDDTAAATLNVPARINGYAFIDDNGNGKFDEKFNMRKAGVEVEIYANGTKMATTTTNAGGYYCFDIPAASNGATFTVKVAGEEISVKGSDDIGNKINENGSSDTFTLRNAKEAVLVNIAIKK